MRLWRLGQSLAGVVTSADRPDPISLRRLRLPRLVLSRRVRFTNRFTEQAIDLQFPAPSAPFRGCRPWARGTVSGLAKRLPSGTALTRDASPPVVPDAGPRAPQSSSPLPGLHRGTDRAAACPDPSPNPAAAGPDGRRVLSRVGAADHAVTPEAPWTGSGWREYSYGGFGGGHPPFHPHTFCRPPYLSKLDYQLACMPSAAAAPGTCQMRRRLRSRPPRSIPALVSRRLPAAAAIGRPGPGRAGIQLRHRTWTDRLGTPITSPGLTTATSWAEISGTAVSSTFDHRAP